MIVHIDASTRYHRAEIDGVGQFTFSFTPHGFGALQRWLRESTAGPLVFSVTPAGGHGAVLIRRLRALGAQAIPEQNMFVLSKHKPGPHVWVPILTPPPETQMI